MKVVFVGIVFNGDFTLEQCIRSILPYGSVYFVEGPVSYYQRLGYATSTDFTNSILDSLLPSDHILHGQFREKDDEAAATERLIPEDADWIWWIDADEFYRDEDIQAILGLLESNQYDCISFRMNSFYGGFQRRMTGFEENFPVTRIQRWYPGAKWATHRPPTILAPDSKSWKEHRHLDHMATDQLGLRMFHYSYVLPSQMKAKSEYYLGYTRGGTIPRYFERVYLPWVLGDDQAKQRIEDEFDGVHDWLPERRGPCRTTPFSGKHPREIECSLPKLQSRIDEELKHWNSVGIPT